MGCDVVIVKTQSESLPPERGKEHGTVARRKRVGQV